MMLAAPVSALLIVIGRADDRRPRTRADHRICSSKTRHRQSSGTAGLRPGYVHIWYSTQMATQALKAPDIIQSSPPGNRRSSPAIVALTADDPHNAGTGCPRSMPARTVQPYRATLRRAIAASPNWFKPHWTLAQLLRKGATRRGEPRPSSPSLNGGKNPEVATLGQIQAKISNKVVNKSKKSATNSSLWQNVSMRLGFVSMVLFVAVASAQTPAIRPDLGVINAAGFGKTNKIAAGSLFSIYGSNLSGTLAQTDSTTLSTSMADVDSVTFTSGTTTIKAPLRFVSVRRLTRRCRGVFLRGRPMSW